MAASRHPDDSPGLTRRVFIHRLTFLGGGAVVLGGCHSKEPRGKAAPAPPAKGIRPQGLTTAHRTFTSDEFRSLSSACDRIVPRDEDPGALDAQVPEYIDRMLQSPELSQMKDEFLAGLAALDRRSQRQLKKPFCELAPTDQDALLTAFKDSARGTGEAHFYELLVVLTLEGLLGDPSYGGNKDQVGWKLVGFNLVGHQAMEPAPGYDGVSHLHHSHGR